MNMLMNIKNVAGALVFDFSRIKNKMFWKLINYISMKHSKILQPRILRIVEIVLLSIFIFSQFLPYVYSVKPKEFYWDIWSSIGYEWQSFIIIGVPLIFSFVLLIYNISNNKIPFLKSKILVWGLKFLFAFFLIWFLINIGTNGFSHSYRILFDIPVILTVILCLGLFLLSIFIVKKNHIKIENILVAIIAIPTVYFSTGFFELDYGGYILSICFAVLYVIAVLKVFLIKNTGE